MSINQINVEMNLPRFSGHTNLTKTGGHYAQNAPSKEDSKVQRRV